jgi:hypothetical protein
MVHAIAISLGVISLAIYIRSSIYWFRLWRKTQGGAAHAIFLHTCLIMLMLLFEGFNQIYDVIVDNSCFGTIHDVGIWFFFAAHATLSLAFVRGYFSPRSDG